VWKKRCVAHGIFEGKVVSYGSIYRTLDSTQNFIKNSTRYYNAKEYTYMSFTGSFHAFVGIHEDALNRIVEAFRAARPWLFSYGHHLLGGGAPPIPTTEIGAITIPGTGTPFPYRVDIPRLVIDCFPEEVGSGLPPELQPLNKDEFDVHADLVLTVLCPGKIEHEKEIKEWKPMKAELSLWAIGSPTAEPAGGTKKRLGLSSRAVEIVDIQPPELEDILECFLKSMLDHAVLKKLTFVLDKISTDFFSFVLADGPHVDKNQIFALGGVL